MDIFSTSKAAPTATDLREESAAAAAAPPDTFVDGGKGRADKVEGSNVTHNADIALEKRVVRKLDRHVPPLVSGLFLLSFLDRSNIGNAEIAGMEKDLDLSSDRYEWLLTIFYIGFFLSMAPLASTFSGALAYGITSGHAKIANWRLLFLVEGLPTIVMAPITWFLMPDSPTTAKFLTEEEKVVARARVVRQVDKTEETGHGSIKISEIGEALLDAKAWATALMYFSMNVSYSSLPVFLPTILKEMGFSSVNAQGLSAPPYFVSFLVTCLTTWIADRTQQRGAMIIFLSIVGGIGYILLAACHSTGVKYLGVFLAASGVFPAIANTLPWVVNNQGSTTRRGASIMLLNLVGQCGPLLGTRIFPKTGAPQYVKGQSICAAFMFFNALLALGNRCLLQWENKRLDRKYGVVDRETQMKVRDGKLEPDANGGKENYGAAYRFVL